MPDTPTPTGAALERIKEILRSHYPRGVNPMLNEVHDLLDAALAAPIAPAALGDVEVELRKIYADPNWDDGFDTGIFKRAADALAGLPITAGPQVQDAAQKAANPSSIVARLRAVARQKREDVHKSHIVMSGDAEVYEEAATALAGMRDALEWIVEDGCSDARAVECAGAALSNYRAGKEKA